MSHATASSILVLKTDSSCADSLGKHALNILPNAHVQTAARIMEAEALFARGPVDLLLTGVQMIDGDVIEKLSAWMRPPSRVRRVLVVTRRRESHVLTALTDLPIDGIFDPSSDGPRLLETALQEIMRGKQYWSQTVLDQIAMLVSRRKGARLTPTEELVLAIFGAGCSNAEAARHLDMATGTVRNHRSNIYRKLGVNNRGDLVRIAAKLGYVYINHDGVARPGLSRLVAARLRGNRKKFAE